MSSFECLDALRKQNKELLMKLKMQTEKLQNLKLACPDTGGQETPESSECVTGKVGDINRKKEDGVAPVRSNGNLFKDPNPIVTTVAVGERPHVAREALWKSRAWTKKAETPKVALSPLLPVILADQDILDNTKLPTLWTQFVQDCEPGGKSFQEVAAEALTPAEHITKESQLPEGTTLPERTVAIGQMKTKSILLQWDRDRGDLDRPSFQSAGPELETTSEGLRMQPLLGYDWIAGLLDAESSLAERSEQFFSELRSFRQVNKEECVHSQSSGFSIPWFSSAEEETADQEHTAETHKCTFCYRINNRLFVTPLDPQAACPVCKMPKAKHPHTENEPAFIRVSIPRSTLLPAYRYKAHRRSSFDPSDSLGLPSHCLSGWSNSSLKPTFQMSNLDLKSSVVNRPGMGLVSLDQDENQLNLSVSRVSGSQRSDQLLDVSRLARYRFQHLKPTRTKPISSSYPVY